MLLGLGFWLGASFLYGHYEKTRPPQPDPGTGRIYAYRHIEHVFYLNAQERLRWRGLLLATGVCLAVMGGAEIYMRRSGKPSHPPPGANP